MKHNKQKKHRPYKLSAYTSDWPRQYEEKKKRILDALGDKVINIYHVGSTSIPNMLAKPQIDILVEVKNLDEVRDNKTIKKMAQAGFTARGDYSNLGEEYYTEDDSKEKRLASIHIFPQGHPKIESILSFRNRILKNKEDRNLYINTKKELYRKHTDNYREYDSGKQGVISKIHKNIELDES